MARYHRPKGPEPKDRPHAGFCLLSLLLPPAGLALYLQWRKSLPRRAEACGITALVSVIASLLTSCLWLIMLLMLVGAIE